MECRDQNIGASPSPSPRHKTRPIIRFPCCSRVANSEDPPVVEASVIRSTPSWIRAKAMELPEMKECCRRLIGKSSGRQFGDFRYDPISYALNFDDGDDGANAELFRLRNPTS
ncbi:uncharacterized protein LOC110100292 [Dendrobium catenatum]|uniref:Uncharacterized protein n=1 Tax=Dendrobium catenatum TaxID=906689 RepID=A0A2I0VZK7_9ASPA|nr:uncharacterized protein LOC110100292 [Dendrobium catenatum]PKU68838.1 hypothetical protein MA16_Dca010582 [Dendrobium catenatum]